VNLSSLCEFVGLTATFAACLFFFRGLRRVRLVGSRTVLGSLLLLYLVNSGANYLEWANAEALFSLDVVEDVADLLSPLVWWFFLYSCCQSVVSGHLRESLADRQRMEQRIRASESHLRGVLDNVPVNIFSIDREGKVLFANREFEHVTTSDVIGASIHALLPPESDDLVRAAIRQLFEDGQTQAFEIIDSKPEPAGGVRSWYTCRLSAVRDAGEIHSAILVAADVAESKRAEQELRDSEQRFRVLVEHAPEAILVFDVDEGQIVDCNANARRLFKLGAEQCIEAGLADLSPPLQPDMRASAERAQEIIERALDGDIPVVQWVCRDREGADFSCEIRLVRLPSSQHRLVRGSVLVKTDEEH
jgi:PAS domain S-box-containing protein